MLLISEASSLVEQTRAAKILVNRLYRRLSTTAMFGSPDQSRNFALSTADEIVSVAEDVLAQVRDALPHVDDVVKENCVPIVDAAVAAYRLRSRIEARSGAEIGLLLDLRNMDLEITQGIRPDPDLALIRYERDIARAVISGDIRRALSGQLAAAERLLNTLADMSAKAIDTESSSSQKIPQNSLGAEKLVLVVTHIAQHLVAHKSESEPWKRAKLCAGKVLTLYGPSARHDRLDAKALLQAAERLDITAAEPLSALKIVKFVGIGEMLFARVLVQIATSETIAAAAAAGHLPEYIKLYTGDDHGEEPRLRALSRAVGLYDRAIAWLRRLGVAGEVRNIAIAEREKALSLLDIRLQNANLRFNHELEFHEIEKRVAELRKMLNTMIVEGILRAELNSWSQVQDRETRRAAAAMMSALDDSWRYLKKPELGLRTDLPPTIESISG